MARNNITDLITNKTLKIHFFNYPDYSQLCFEGCRRKAEQLHRRSCGRCCTWTMRQSLCLYE